MTVRKHIINFIKISESLGLKVDADMSSTNRTMWKSSQYVKTVPYIQQLVEPCRKLSCFSDPPHLFKNISEKKKSLSVVKKLGLPAN